jgi:hypothetical protein
LDARERRPIRPTPGDRGSWSHGPIARVQPRAGDAAREAAVELPPPVPPYAAGRRAPAAPPMRPMGPGGGRTFAPPVRAGFGLPSLRRNVCPHFYMTGPRGAIPIQAPHLLKGLLRQPNNVSRCQLRGGVHLDEGYVNDVCLTPRFNQCVFYEDELTKG